MAHADKARQGIALFGAQGQLGRALAQVLAGLGPVHTLSHADCDIGDETAVHAAVRRLRPGVIVNAAAYTAVDKAEAERDTALRINAYGPGYLADAALSVGAWLVHYSTDYVFDGTAGRPYREDDLTAPLNVYGESKRLGEEAVLARPLTAFVLRTAWLYDREGRNFLTTVRRLAANGPLRIVCDQYGSPTPVTVLAQTTRAILVHPRAADCAGLYHAACDGATSWHGFAEAIVRSFGLAVAVLPITTADYPTAAHRPAYSVLDGARLKEHLGITLPSWDRALADLFMERP
ncbi:dTDP-4-dehydrorhamnose reductase [Acidiferrobacter thiooxydans]|jgi:dTDP-4-dehydrorhamnose reductase|uniref:dTDP-4-dehydrorhamnose reductase n=1 Tax=Acidiferrobacter thiooxydans TaxID=163359 RepID=UPI0008244891|nr:dTDP-4-dehydrorhamnose reductase [Acidiferrobacter thiooxydans]MDA8190865.1 dTDP-4-dehydrorhamnose reductase [Gammaproteobacteria bacterium]UEO00854.1 dTDP-4-dehydrorhamnose reductase [Acidiferrobacter thiooxydans]